MNPQILAIILSVVMLLLLMQISLELARTRDELRKVVQSIAVDMEEQRDGGDDRPGRAS